MSEQRRWTLGERALLFGDAHWCITDGELRDGESIEACPVSELDAALAERDALKAEACRYYNADGTFIVMDSPEAVVAARKAAAVQLHALRTELIAERTAADRLAEALRNLWRVENGDIGAGMKRAAHMESARVAIIAHDARRQPATEGEANA